MRLTKRKIKAWKGKRQERETEEQRGNERREGERKRSLLLYTKSSKSSISLLPLHIKTVYKVKLTNYKSNVETYFLEKNRSSFKKLYYIYKYGTTNQC